MRTGLNDARWVHDAVNAGLAWPDGGSARPGGLTVVVTATKPHEDTAQSSGYEVLAGWSIKPGYNSDSA
jgi:hypothetical protein